VKKNRIATFTQHLIVNYQSYIYYKVIKRELVW